MSEIRLSLRKYFDILKGQSTANYLICKYVPVDFNYDDSTDSLWDKHNLALDDFGVRDEKPGLSLLDLKVELADRIFKDCHFCERKCGVDRSKGEKGFCGVKDSRIASEFLHMGEESVLVPSYTIFFSGCTFDCVFCQNWDISQHSCGFYIEPSVLAENIGKKRENNARNVNWVGGDPTPNLLYILQVLRECKVNIPQVWNSNMYCSEESMKLLDGVVDLYLTDFKYGNDECANRLSNVNNYMDVVTRNHRLAYSQAEMIIRHLLLPNHVDCCSKTIFEWIKENTPGALVNVMDQYRPDYKANNYNDITRALSLDEYSKAKEVAKKKSLNFI